MVCPKPARRAAGAAAFLVGAMLAFAGTAGAHHPEAAQRAEPGAGAWRTWVLSSGAQFRLPPPPDAAATRAELERLRSMAASVDAEAQERIGWWNAAAPSYRWGQIAAEASVKAGLNSLVASRRLALLHTALADATVAVWDSKYAHNRPRPAAADPALKTALPTPPSPSYPDEHAAAGAVAAAVLGELFPPRAAEFARLAQEEAKTRLLAGVAYPSDVVAGAELGRKVAAAALERSKRDRSDLPWTGTAPTGPGVWTGTPVMPQAASWVPWLLASPSELRPPPPPAHDSPERAAEMAELRAMQRTPKTNADALFWEAAVGGARSYDFWNNQLGRLLMEHGQAADAPRAARAYALLNVAYYDAAVACWDAKFAYWTARPVQFDPEFLTVFPTISHPSYPSAHSCLSTAATAVLRHLFPWDAAALAALAKEGSESRMWAGIHFRSDIDSGRQLAEKVAGRAIERARTDGAER